MRIYSKISATGKYLPRNVLTNNDLENLVETSDEWITERTGIKERRIADDTLSTSDLAYYALSDALKKYEIEADRIDALIVATGTPDRLFPSTATRVAKLLSAKNAIPAFDILAACAGFNYALEVGRSMIESGLYKMVAIVGAEVLSKFVNWKDRTTCILFGDGAGAVILEPSEKPGFLYSNLYTDGSLDYLLEIPGGGSILPANRASDEMYKIKMQGREVFKHAVTKLSAALSEALEKTSLKPSDIEALFAHQANKRIVDAVAERAGFTEEQIPTNIEKYGNTSSASIPLLLDEYISSRGLKAGKIYVFLSFGAGFVWGVHIYKHQT